MASAVAAVVTSSGDASASEPSTHRITERQFSIIIDRAWTTGALNSADRAQLMTRPDLASYTIDPSSVTPDFAEPSYVPDPMEVREGTKPSDMPAGPLDATASFATRTTTRDRYVSYTTLGGIKARYHFVVSWSYNGTSVVGKPSSHTYVANCAGSCSNYGITSNGQYPNYGGSRIYAWTVPLLARWRYCKAGSCDQDHTPSVRFGVYFDGTYSYVSTDDRSDMIQNLTARAVIGLVVGALLWFVITAAIGGMTDLTLGIVLLFCVVSAVATIIGLGRGA